MKYLLSIFFFFVVAFCNGQVVRIAPSEYATYNIKSDGTLWSSGGNLGLLGRGGQRKQALPNLVQQYSLAPMPLFKSVWAALDDVIAIDVSSNAWHVGGSDLSSVGNGSKNPDWNNPDTAYKYKFAIKITTDSTGQPFTGITGAAQYYNSTTCKGWFAVKGTDSTLWIWGGDDLGSYNGTGTPIPYMTRPFKVPLPPGKKVLQVVAGSFVAALCSDGTVLTWGGNGCDDYNAALGNGCSGNSYKFPRQVIGLSNVKWIDGGQGRAFAIKTDNTVWGWGDGSQLGIGTENGSPEIVPINVSAIWNFSGGRYVTKIVSNVNASHVILNDSTLWGFGNSPQGEVGNGAHLDRDLPPYPSHWSWNYSTPLWVTSPVQIVPTRHDFINIYGGMIYTYWAFFEASNGQIYFTGRNKGAVADEGIINADTASGATASLYESAWDRAYAVPVDIFSVRKAILVPAQPCFVSEYPGCSDYTIPPNAPPTITTEANKTINVFTTTLYATSSPQSGRVVASYVWSQLTGPNTAYFSTFNDSAVTISRLTYGTYTFRITATDNLNSSNYDDITVIVSAGSGSYNGGIQVVAAGDYTTHFVDNTGTLIGIGNEGFIGGGAAGSFFGSTGRPQPVLSAPGVPIEKIKTGAGHYHGAAFADVYGFVWTVGATGGGESGLGNDTYSGYARKILTDTLGNAFDSVTAIVAVAQSTGDDIDQNGYLALKSTGTLWYWGTIGAMRGDGTTSETYKATKPTRIYMPGGRLVSQIKGGQTKYVIALCTDGTVWTWGNAYRANLGYIPNGTEYATPHQILSNGAYIEGGSEFNYCIKTNGDLYGWGLKGNLMNDLTFADGSGAEITFPILLVNIQNYLPYPIAKLVTSVATTTALLTNGDIYSWGDNTQGGVGNGQTYFGNFFGDDSPGYTYDGITHLLQKIPINIAPTKKFKNIFSGNLLTYYTYALDTSDQLYAWGLNRSSEIANRVEQPTSGVLNGFDNAWNVTWPTPVNPFTISPTATRITSTCPACIVTPNIPPCSYYTIPANTKPTARTSGNQTVIGSSTILDGSASTDNVYISYYYWSQVSGAYCVIDLPASPTPTVTQLAAGTYVFRLIVVDNGWLSDTTTVTVTVGSGSNLPPTASAGTSFSITLPQSATRLYGSGTAVGLGNSITTYAWTQVSGTAATIVTPAAAQTNIAGLTTTGARVFRLTVTDNNGNTATSDITITVQATCN